jgi:hypothetical protein
MRGRYADPAYRQRLALRGSRRYQRETADQRWEKAITYRAKLAGLSAVRITALHHWLQSRGEQYVIARDEFLKHGYAHRLGALLVTFRISTK